MSGKSASLGRLVARSRRPATTGSRQSTAMAEHISPGGDPTAGLPPAVSRAEAVTEVGNGPRVEPTEAPISPRFNLVGVEPGPTAAPSPNPRASARPGTRPGPGGRSAVPGPDGRHRPPPSRHEPARADTDPAGPTTMADRLNAAAGRRRLPPFPADEEAGSADPEPDRPQAAPIGTNPTARPATRPSATPSRASRPFPVDSSRPGGPAAVNPGPGPAGEAAHTSPRRQHLDDESSPSSDPGATAVEAAVVEGHLVNRPSPTALPSHPDPGPGPVVAPVQPPGPQPLVIGNIEIVTPAQSHAGPDPLSPLAQRRRVGRRRARRNRS